MVQIIPTILVKTSAAWQQRVNQLADISQRLQVDILDGRFANNTTISIDQIKNDRGLILDIHLMVEEPINWVEPCRSKGASLVIGQIEKMSGQRRFVEIVKWANMKAGLALDLETDVNRLDANVINLVDHILIMSVKAGFSGQLFDERVLAKIKAVRSMVGEKIEIGVDGGINETNIRQVVETGADVVYVGKALWEATNIQEKLNQLWSFCTL